MSEEAIDVAPALADLRAEGAALEALVGGLSDAELARETPFYGWRAQDVLTHLAFVDRLALLAVTDPPACAAAVAAMGEGVQAPEGDESGDKGRFQRLSAYENDMLGEGAGRERRRRWRTGFGDLVSALADHDGARQLEWFGRPMKLSTLVQARQMEIWAYGQDVFDLFRAHRPEGERLRNVADFAVKTFRFAFANRGLTPGPAPHVVLTSPAGAIWRWNDPGSPERITGAAVEFCLVATQRRNVADTALVVAGETARIWMQIAQCIAGPPVAGPDPGQRAWW